MVSEIIPICVNQTSGTGWGRVIRGRAEEVWYTYQNCESGGNNINKIRTRIPEYLWAIYKRGKSGRKFKID